MDSDSHLDLGADPGMASWIGGSRFPEIQKVTLVDQDEELIQLGQRLASHSRHTVLDDRRSGSHKISFNRKRLTL